VAAFPTTRTKTVLLLSLYAAQGLPFGFFTQALPVIMRQQDYALRWIGLSHLLALPWALKWLWASTVDRTYVSRIGRRRSWILPLQTASCLVLAALGLLGQGDVGWLVVGCFLTNLFAATQDIATDGLAVEQLGPTERGWGNGIQVAGYRVGMIVGSSAILVLLDAWGWALAMFTLSTLLALLSLPVWSYRERPAPVQPHEEHPLLSFLKQPRVGMWLLVLVSYKFGDALATAMFKPLMVDAGLTLTEIGWLGGALGSASGLTGALLGGVLFNRLTPAKALLTFGSMSALCVLSYGLWGSNLGVRGFAALTALEHLTGGMATVALFTCMMSQCRPGHEGSDYTIQASIVVVSTGGAAALSGFVAEALGYSWLFFIACGLASAAAALAFAVSQPKAQGSA
jgi:MFS transporter, PAT family, beta-lactamase induction signal transducer AmpG